MNDDQRELVHKLFVRYRPGVHRFFTHQGFSSDEARALAQDVFVRVSQNIGNLRSEAAADAWVRRITANVWKNELRRRGAIKRDVKEVSLGAEGEPGNEAADHALPVGAAPAPNPLEQALVSEELAAARACLDELAPKMRQCLWLYVFQDRHYREIADLLHVSIETVKSHVHEARQQVKRCMARRVAAGER